MVFCVFFTGSLSANSYAQSSGKESSSGTAQVTANIPQFIVLHYYSALTLNFETPTSEAIAQGDNTMSVSWDGSTSGDQLSTANLMTADLELEGTKTTVTMPNVWAVRGFSNNGLASVAVTIPTGGGELSNGTSVIGMSNVKVSDGENTGESIKTNLGGIAKASATIGSIMLDLDFSKTNRAGKHSGGQYTITAAAI